MHHAAHACTSRYAPHHAPRHHASHAYTSRHAPHHAPLPRRGRDPLSRLNGGPARCYAGLCRDANVHQTHVRVPSSKAGRGSLGPAVALSETAGDGGSGRVRAQHRGSVRRRASFKVVPSSSVRLAHRVGPAHAHRQVRARMQVHARPLMLMSVSERAGGSMQAHACVPALPPPTCLNTPLFFVLCSYPLALLPPPAPPAHACVPSPHTAAVPCPACASMSYRARQPCLPRPPRLARPAPPCLPRHGPARAHPHAQVQQRDSMRHMRRNQSWRDILPGMPAFPGQPLMAGAAGSVSARHERKSSTYFVGMLTSIRCGLAAAAAAAAAPASGGDDGCAAAQAARALELRPAVLAAPDAAPPNTARPMRVFCAQELHRLHPDRRV